MSFVFFQEKLVVAITHYSNNLDSLVDLYKGERAAL